MKDDISIGLNKIGGYNPKYSHNEKIEIIDGYYKGYKGTITGYNVDNDKIFYHVNIDEYDIVVNIFEDDMAKVKIKKTLIKRLFGR